MAAGCADLRALDPRAPDRAGKDYSGASEFFPEIPSEPPGQIKTAALSKL